MFSSNVKLVSLVLLIINILFNSVNCLIVDGNIDNVLEAVQDHSRVLNEFPEYMGRTKALEKQVADILLKINALTVYEAHTKNLLADVSELMETRANQAEKIDTLEAYKKKTELIDNDVNSLKEAVETYGASLSSLDLYKRRTNTLEEYVIQINEALSNNTQEKKVISEKVETLQSDFQTAHNNIQAKVEELGKVSEEQQNTNRDLKSLEKQLSEQKDALSSFRNTCTDEIQEMKTKLQRLDEVTTEQKALQQSLKLLTLQLQEYILAHTEPPTTPSTTPDPSNEPRVFRKRAHARGNNIRITL